MPASLDLIQTNHYAIPVRQTNEREKMIQTYKVDHALGSGTSLQGYVTTTLRRLITAFGQPQYHGEGDKVTVDWAMVFEDGTVATVYDWKRYELGTPALDEVFQYNIGGENKEAAYLVKKAVMFAM